MRIHGKEVTFALTVGASAEIAKLCPGGDLRKVGEMLGESNYGQSVDFIAQFIEILSRWGAKMKKWEGENYDTLSLDEILSLSPTEFSSLQMEAMSAFGNDGAGEIDAESTDPKNAEQEGL